MPTNVEIRPQEVFRSLESWKRWFMTMLLIGFLAVACKDVDAADADTMYAENQAIELTVENITNFYDSLNQSNDVELPMNPEREILRVNIRSGVNVRSLDSSASTINGFPRGSADVVGYFNATTADSFGRVATGIWFVINNNGELGAVHSNYANEVDETKLTAEELNEAGISLFTFEMGVPTPPAPVQTEVEPTEGASTEDEAGVEVAMAPSEGLIAPEVPSSFSVSTSEYSAASNSFIWVENTVTPTGDIMPLPFGIVDLNRYPQLRNFAQLIESNFRFGSRTEMVDFRAMGIHAIFVKSSGDGSGGNIYHFAIPMEGQSEDEWATFTTTTLPGTLAILPVSNQLQPINDPNNLLVVDPGVRLGASRFEIAANPVVPGDILIVFVYDSQNDNGTAADSLRRVCNGLNTQQQVELISEGDVCTTMTGFDVSPNFTIGGIASPNE